MKVAKRIRSFLAISLSGRVGCFIGGQGEQLSLPEKRINSSVLKEVGMIHSETVI